MYRSALLMTSASVSVRYFQDESFPKDRKSKFIPSACLIADGFPLVFP
jgi:hypothetical protein